MADDRRTDKESRNEGATPLRQGTGAAAQRGLAETARRGVEAGADAARGAAAAGAEASRVAVEGSARQSAQQAEQVVGQLAEAAQVYQGVARRVAAEIRTLAGAPLAVTGGAQELSRAWAEWLQTSLQTNARFSQEALRARSLPEVAQAYARFVEESLAGLREGGTRMLEAVGGLAERAREPLGQGEEDEGPLTVADVMTENVRVADPEQTAQEAAAEMARGDVGVLPVVAGGGAEGQILGMLTDRDLAVRVVAAGKDPAKTKVREAMTTGAEYCLAHADVAGLAERMAELKVRRLPVLDRERRRVVGIVSLGDLATEQPDPELAGRALGGIAQEGGPHRQRLARPRAAAARQRQQQRRR
jgi:CBS domain-containing protein